MLAAQVVPAGAGADDLVQRKRLVVDLHAGHGALDHGEQAVVDDELDRAGERGAAEAPGAVEDVRAGH